MFSRCSNHQSSLVNENHLKFASHVCKRHDNKRLYTVAGEVLLVSLYSCFIKKHTKSDTIQANVIVQAVRKNLSSQVMPLQHSCPSVFAPQRQRHLHLGLKVMVPGRKLSACAAISWVINDMMKFQPGISVDIWRFQTFTLKDLAGSILFPW